MSTREERIAALSFWDKKAQAYKPVTTADELVQAWIYADSKSHVAIFLSDLRLLGLISESKPS